MSSAAQAPWADKVLEGSIDDIPEPCQRAMVAAEQAQRRMLDPATAAPFRAAAAPSWQEDVRVRLLAVDDVVFISDDADEPGPSGGLVLFG